MKLSEEELKVFYKLFPSLLLYVNNKLKIIKNISDIDTLMSLPPAERIKIRDKLYQDIELINDYTNKNPQKFSLEELEIIHNWKYFIKGTFYLMKHLKSHTIFLSSNSNAIAYGVLALFDRFDYFYPRPPIMVETVLLPFKDQIIYDGYIQSHNIIFGGGIRKTLNDSYNLAKAQYGIVTKLPFITETKEQNEVEKLKFYLKNERNREMYWDEIVDMIDGNDELEIVFHQETGKSYARKYSKKLHKIGFKKVWFGILEGMIIASGETEKEVNHILDKILPPIQKKYVYIFQLKAK